MNTIHNQNPFGSRITSLTLLNENDSVMVAAGSDEGVVRIWGGLQDPSRTKLVTAWRVLVWDLVVYHVAFFFHPGVF